MTRAGWWWSSRTAYAGRGPSATSSTCRRRRRSAGRRVVSALPCIARGCTVHAAAACTVHPLAMQGSALTTRRPADRRRRLQVDDVAEGPRPAYAVRLLHHQPALVIQVHRHPFGGPPPGLLYPHLPTQRGAERPVRRQQRGRVAATRAPGRVVGGQRPQDCPQQRLAVQHRRAFERQRRRWSVGVGLNVTTTTTTAP